MVLIPANDLFFQQLPSNNLNWGCVWCKYVFMGVQTHFITSYRGVWSWYGCLSRDKSVADGCRCLCNAFYAQFNEPVQRACSSGVLEG